MLRRNKTEIGKDYYIWRRKIYFFRHKENQVRKPEIYIVGDGKYVFCRGEDYTRGKEGIFG